MAVTRVSSGWAVFAIRECPKIAIQKHYCWKFNSTKKPKGGKSNQKLIMNFSLEVISTFPSTVRRLLFKINFLASSCYK